MRNVPNGSSHLANILELKLLYIQPVHQIRFLKIFTFLISQRGLFAYTEPFSSSSFL